MPCNAVQVRIRQPGGKPIAGDSSAPDSQERAYEYIKEGILDQRFLPGHPLRAQELAEALSLSRTPIREALGRLAQEGLVERLGGWGFTVRALTVQDVLDLFNVREALEVEAARAALEIIGEADVARFDALLGQSRRALEKGKLIESIRLARRFHVAVAQASGNRLLLQMLEGINDRVHIVGLSLVATVPERAAQVHDENMSILDSLRNRDANALERAVRAHIHRSRDLFMKNSGRYRLQ